MSENGWEERILLNFCAKIKFYKSTQKPQKATRKKPNAFSDTIKIMGLIECNLNSTEVF